MNESPDERPTNAKTAPSDERPTDDSTSRPTNARPTNARPPFRSESAVLPNRSNAVAAASTFVSKSAFLPDVPLERWTPDAGARDEFFMRRALDEAALAAEEGEIPIGAVLVCQNRILARDHNRRERLCDPTAHAETLVVRAASVFYPSWRIEDSELFVTLEPCVMCAGALVQARVGRVVFGTRDPKGGAAVSLFELLDDARLNWRCEVVEGVLRDECAETLRSFFRARRSRSTKN